MKRDRLRTILENELGASDNDGRYALPHGTRLTVFVATGNAILPVPKVDALVFNDGHLTLETDEGRTFTDAEAIAAVRADEEARKRADAKVGFG